MKKLIQFGFAVMISATFFSCKKSSDENTTLSTPPLQIGEAVSDAAPLKGSIKGTMLSGKTYTLGGDVLVNAGDTLVIQPGVTINVGTNGYNFGVKGTFLSLGTKDAPIWFTVPGLAKNDAPGANPLTDPAFSGKWCGINCDTSVKLCVIKWTHIEFASAAFGTSQINGNKSGDNSFAVFFQNPNGVFIFEDSWVYGTIDDAMRPNGKFNIMRNTFEKIGYQGGDIINVKSGGQGNAAYNLFIGGATNATKASNKGGTPVQADCYYYNNTYVNMGYRQANPTGRGGSWNFEEGAKGKAYNGLLVNCRTGLRIVFNPLADTANIAYGNNFNYGDSIAVYNWTYPPADLSKPKSTDIPTPSSYLPSPYTIGQVYTANASIVGSNNPKFVNYPLPATSAHLQDISSVGSFDFRLQSSSPAIGKGFTGFTPLAVVPIDKNYGATEVTLPGADCGAYQSNGKGNQH